VAVLAIGGGCAAPQAPVETDLAPPVDLAPPPSDLRGATDLGPACTLGSPDHCGTCTTVCPPGMDNDGTQRTCSGPSSFDTCGIVCKGDYYDVNGLAADGCEVLDDAMLANAAIAQTVTLPDTDDPTFMSNPLNVVRALPSDGRQHAVTPASRPLGLPDWYKVNAVGPGASGTGMVACLGITGLPADNRFEVCISALNMQTFEPASCATAYGGPPEMGTGSVCVTPPGATDEGMYYYVRVQKLAGSHTANRYALFLKH
jgi:hypothetical protein